MAIQPRKLNQLTFWATVAGSVVAIGTGISLSYDTLFAQKAQIQIDSCIAKHEIKQTKRDEKIDMLFERMVENQTKQGEALARIEGELRAIRGRR